MKETARTKQCFVISPFGGAFDRIYKQVLRPAIVEAGLKPIRADEISKPGAIVDQIWSRISDASVCLADLTGRNPNVLYEIGIAHAVQKPVVQIVQDLNDLPFDLRNVRHIVYSTSTVSKCDDLKRRVTEMLLAALRDPKGAVVLPARTTVPKAENYGIQPVTSRNGKGIRSNPYWEITSRLDLARKGDLIQFIAMTGRSFMAPPLRIHEELSLRRFQFVGALGRGVRFEGVVLDPKCEEAQFRAEVESPDDEPEERLLLKDAAVVAKLPQYYRKYPRLLANIHNLSLKYTATGLAFSLWIFSDCAIVEPFHFGKMDHDPNEHLCGFCKVIVPRSSKEYEILLAHFDVLFRNGENVWAMSEKWRRSQASGHCRDVDDLTPKRRRGASK